MPPTWIFWSWPDGKKNCVWGGGGIVYFALVGTGFGKWFGLRPGRLSRVGPHATDAAKTPPGPEGSNGMEVLPGAVGVLACDDRLGRSADPV